MKRILVLLLLPFLDFAQNDTIKNVASRQSVIGLDRMNVVYRGVPNPISIAVNNTKSYKIIGDGVSQNEDGKYIIRPGAGKETKVFVEIEKLDGSKSTEEYTFRIKGLPRICGTLKGKEGEVILKRNEVKEAIISTEMIGFLYDVFDDSDFFKVNSFEVKFSESKVIKVVGNKFDSESFKEIAKLKRGDFFEINHLDYGPPTDALKRRAFPIIVMMGD
ncbi:MULTISPECIES: GldM family protein [Flavobacterium]|uniref:Gliding motility-associated protein GldM second immunoglobulin-like domain-containing protein n=1 Tax=Flavobacterium hankyongi TaxID=1176532 RepID=A0ABP8ZQ19_9FLAO|nr:GldM family protein [Flavobacterium sp. N1846]